MEIKYTLQGLLIYAAMASYLAGFLMVISRRRDVGGSMVFLGFIFCLASYIYRWVHVGHVPMQNLFEVFLSLGVLIWPISMLCRHYMRFSGLFNEASDSLLAFIILFPPGFVLHAAPARLPPALQSWLFIPHVSFYLLGGLLMAKAALQAGYVLWGRYRCVEGAVNAEEASFEAVCLGFPMISLGFFLGSVWGKFAWGDYWGWDPKELWSLAAWLVYAGYFHFRYMFGRRFPVANSILVLTGMLFIIITLLWVNLSRLFPGLHNYAA